MLDRYRCLVAFHVVRSRFLGGIATPIVKDAVAEARGRSARPRPMAKRTLH